jgi:hypothetical protein
MSDNGSKRGNQSGLGGGQIRVMSHHRTEAQLRPFEGFSPDEIVPRNGVHLVSEGERHLQLAKPYPWTWRDDINCLGEYEATDTTNRAEAAKLCAGCPVLSQCLESAMEEEVNSDGEPLSHHSRFLVRGGLTPRGRVELAAQRVEEAKDTAV